MGTINEDFKRGLWPQINTKEDAKKAAKQGVYASILIVLASIVVRVGQITGHMTGYDEYGIAVTGICFVIIALGIFLMSRTAAVIGLLLFLAGSVIGFSRGINIVQVIFALAFLLSFLNAIRGTCAWRNLQ